MKPLSQSEEISNLRDSIHKLELNHGRIGRTSTHYELNLLLRKWIIDIEATALANDHLLPILPD